MQECMWCVENATTWDTTSADEAAGARTLVSVVASVMPVSFLASAEMSAGCVISEPGARRSVTVCLM